MNFNVKDKVSFSGDIDMPALPNTVVAHVDVTKQQVIIEHPNGHLGVEFTNTPGLDANKKYTFVKLKDLALIGKAQTIETVLETPVTSTDASEAKPTPLSVALQMVKNVRPQSEADLFDEFIAKAIKQETKAADAAKKDHEKNIAAENKKQQNEALAADAAEANELTEETKKRLQDEAKAKAEILSMVNYLVKKGVIVFEEARRVWIFEGVVLPFMVGGVFTPEMAIVSFYENMQDELEALKANVLKHVALDQAGTPAETTAAATAAQPKTDSGADFKSKKEAENAAVLAAREAKANADKEAKEKEGAEKPAKSEESDSKKEAMTEPKVTAKNDTAKADADTYAADLLALDGVGAKAVQKIMDAYPTKGHLAAGVASKSLPFTDKVNDALKKAMKKKAFKVA